MKLADEMKHHHYHHDNRGWLPQSSASGHHSSLTCDCDHQLAMKEISREQSLVTQLRAIVLPALQQADEHYELVVQMFQSILDCSRKAMAELQRHQADDDDARADDVQLELVDDNKRVRSISDDCISMEGVVKPHHHQLKRGNYYRCAYRQEQGCKATKTTQQQDDCSTQALIVP